MICPKCRVAMIEARRSHHKQRKWICPRCRRARMQSVSRSKGGRR